MPPHDAKFTYAPSLTAPVRTGIWAGCHLLIRMLIFANNRLSMSEVTMNLDYLKKNKTSLAVAVMAVYISYTALSQYWVHLSLAYGAFQNLRNMPQEHIDDFFAAYKHLEARRVHTLKSACA